MIDKISEIIREQLPQKVGEELKSELERLYAIEKENGKLNERVKGLEDKYNAQSELIKELNEQLSVAGDLDSREYNVKEKEVNLKVQELEYKLQATTQSKTDIFGLVSLFVKNPRAIEIISGDNFSSDYNSQTGYQETRSTSVNRVVEKKETKSEDNYEN